MRRNQTSTITFESPPMAEWNQYFLIDTLTGDIKSAPESHVTIDRERICPVKEEAVVEDCRVSLIISINQKLLVSLHIIVDDINDSPPRFIKNGQTITEITLVLPENAKVGKFTAALPAAFDPDVESASGGIVYDMIGVGLPFLLDGTMARGGRPRLLLSNPLDYEQTSMYTFFLQACESPAHKQPLCSSIHVTIHVENVNDNHPVFVNSTYRAVIDEDTSVQTTVLTVTALDADHPPFGNVSYHISKATASTKIPFGVDERTGAIYTTASPLEPMQYSFVVEATDEPDNGGNRASTVVLITIVDVNNHRPAIELRRAVNTSNSRYLKPEGVFVVELQEETQEPTVLAYLTVTDLDQGENALCSCILTESPLSPRFDLTRVNQISPQVTVYRLMAIKAVDAEDPVILGNLFKPIEASECREVAGFLSISVKCADSGQLPLETVETIFIALRDIDEYPTKFSFSNGEGIYRLSIPEDTDVGTRLLDLVVTDHDTGKCIRFSTIEPTVHIDTHGSLLLAKPLDYEKTRSLSFIVYAYEAFGGTKSTQNASALVEIEILNVNDNQPHITEPSPLPYSECNEIKADLYGFSPEPTECFSLEVTEEAEVGFVAGQLVAKDADEPDRVGGFIFNLEGAYGPPSTLKRNGVPVTSLKVTKYGEILVSGRLDREQFAWVNLLVSLSDGELSSTSVIRVKLRDINDNRPMWQFPSEIDHHITVSMLAQVGAVISRVQALDADSGLTNSALEYSILPQEKALSDLTVSGFQKDQLSRAVYAAHLFSIDANTGKLVVNQTLPNRTDFSYRLDIQARDKGSPQLASISHLLISLSDKPFIEMAVHEAPIRSSNNLQNDGTAEYPPTSTKSTTDDPGPKSTSSQLEGWIHIAGISVGVLSVLFFIAILSFTYFRRMQRGSRALCHKPPRQLQMDSHQGTSWIKVSKDSPVHEVLLSHCGDQGRPSVQLQTTSPCSSHLPVVSIPSCSIAISSSCSELVDLNASNNFPIIVSVAVLPENQFPYPDPVPSSSASGPEYVVVSDAGGGAGGTGPSKTEF